MSIPSGPCLGVSPITLFRVPSGRLRVIQDPSPSTVPPLLVSSTLRAVAVAGSRLIPTAKDHANVPSQQGAVHPGFPFYDTSDGLHNDVVRPTKFRPTAGQPSLGISVGVAFGTDDKPVERARTVRPGIRHQLRQNRIPGFSEDRQQVVSVEARHAVHHDR